MDHGWRVACPRSPLLSFHLTAPPLFLPCSSKLNVPLILLLEPRTSLPLSSHPPGQTPALNEYVFSFSVCLHLGPAENLSTVQVGVQTWSEFPGAPVIEYHKLGDLNSRNLFSRSSKVQKSKISSTEPKSKCQLDHIPSGGCRGVSDLRGPSTWLAI